MGFYGNHVLPHLIALAMRHRDLASYRRRVLSGAEGRVLEVGIGSGLNLPFYRSNVSRIIGLDPSPRLLDLAQRQGKAAGISLDLLQGSAQAIPLDDASIDTVTMTWTLCSIPNAPQALVEIRRVLKPSGSLLFVEHGAAPDPGVAAWQNRLTPFWRRIAGGCRLNRDVAGLLRTAGFEIVELHQGYMRGPRPFTFMSEGRARPS